MDEVARGLACGCTCPDCGGALVAKKGALRTHHFAHHRQSACSGLGESALHEALKNELSRTGTLMLCEARWEVELPWWVYNEAGRKQALERLPPLKGTREARRAVFDEVETEPTLGAIRPDATATKDGRTLAVEFKVTHGVDEPKRRVYEGQKISCIEVDASELPRDVWREAIGAFLRDTDAARHWVFHAPTDAPAKEAKARAEDLWTSFPKRQVRGHTSIAHSRYGRCSTTCLKRLAPRRRAQCTSPTRPLPVHVPRKLPVLPRPALDRNRRSRRVHGDA